ncbi:DNA-dependent ATPase FUN30 [Sporobolomyces salmoneus]|uniref:DNA-dependent ATPase FUN30 n=1 Tax=Sporobolomyces salmoneus TaxID=183962 RepID=UPI00317CCB58
MNGQEPNGETSNNPAKRALEHSPPSTSAQPLPFNPQQPIAAPPFQTNNPAASNGNNSTATRGARTIYSGKLGSSFGSPAPTSGNGSPAPPSLDGGGNDTDGYGNMFYGQRTTGMGRSGSQDSAMSQGVANHPQDQPRKRLRRGGPTGGDETEGEEGAGSFTANLQNRLADVHVESGPSSAASSVYGGSAAPTPATAGSLADLASNMNAAMSSPPIVRPGSRMRPPTVQDSPGQQGEDQKPNLSPSLAGAYPPQFQPPQQYGGAPSPQLQQQQYAQQGMYPTQGQGQGQGAGEGSGTPTGGGGVPSAQANLNDPGFRSFFGMVGTNFAIEKVWNAYQRSGGDINRGLQILLEAKPLVSNPAQPSAQPPQQSYSPAAQYAQLNSPHLSAPGTPGSSHAALGSGQPPQISSSQQQYSEYLRNPSQFANMQHQQQSQSRAQIQTMMRPVQTPQGYPQPGMMMNGQQQQQMMAQQQQQQQQMAYARSIAGGQNPNFPRGTVYPPIPGQPPIPQQPGAGGQPHVFPAASIGYAGFTDAHYNHYIELQRSYFAGKASPEDQKALMQYATVLQRHAASGHRPPNQAYSQAGVYAGQAGGGGTPQQQTQVPFKRGPGRPPKNPQQHYAPKHLPPQTSGSILARQLAAASALGSATKKKVPKKKAYGSDSDDDGGDYDSAGSGDEYGSRENPAAVARREQLAVEFFNTCEKELLMELAGCNASQATITMKLRPFVTANDFRTRTRKQKGIGNNMMDTYLDVVTGMGEVDKVLNECEEIGRQLSHTMSIWAHGAAASASNASTKPGASGDQEVGLDLVAISEETIRTQVETSNNPAVREAFRDYIRTQPAGVPDTVTLKDYQMLGVNWLNLLYRRGTSCILADEMGLGKTAQVIALLAHLKATGDPGPHLVIVPSSTLENWMRELSVFAPDLIAYSYYGSQAERDEIRRELRSLEELNVVVTTYNIATGSPDDQKFLKRKMNFKVAVFDEGHQLKNSESKKYKDLMQIRAQWRLLLTGTPLQNNLQELVSLLSFILPEQFRDANESLKAIFKVGPGNQTNLLSRERISRAKKMMTPFVLRRKKAQVLKDLPKKLERIEYCEMTPLQREVYDEAIQRSRHALTDAKPEDIEEIASDEEGVDKIPEENAAPPPAAKRGRPKKKAAASTKSGNKADTSSSTHVLTDLRKASNHPMLFRRLYDDNKLKLMSRDCLKEEEFLDRNKDLIYEDMEVMTDFELHRFCQGYKHLAKYCLTNDEWMSAGKIAKLQELLPDLRKNGDRVLIFSQFTQVLDILEVVLDTMNIKYLKLTGQTNVTERQGLCDAYNGDPEITVFLLSTRAGGLGLNLTAANTVMFYDCDYNPHNDKQAEDRAYRIGQTRDVTVIKLITRNSIDDDMYSLAQNKLNLEREVSSGVDTKQNVASNDVDDGAGGKEVASKMRSSLLKNLQSRFAAEESQAASQTQKPPA